MIEKQKILVIEDDPSLLMMIVYLLANAQLEVLTAISGDKGMKLIQEEKVDLVTLDIDLPDISGFEICQRLKQNPRLCHLPVIFISGRIFEEDRQRAFELGAADYIEKPFDVELFVERIMCQLETARSCKAPGAKM